MTSDALLLAHSAETHAKIIDAYKEHGTIRKTANALDLPKSTVHDHLRREGISTSTESGPPVEDMPGRIIPSKGEAEQSDEEARKLQEQSQTDEENAEPLPKGTPPIPQDISPMDMESLQDPQERKTPSHRFALEAVYRYVNCLANGVHPTYAENAAKQIDPTFYASPEETDRWQTALESAGYNPRAMPLSERPLIWLFSSPDPPGYISDIYDQFAMSDGDTSDLADLIEQIRQDAYLSGVNEQLTSLNLDNIDAITDPDVLAQITSDAQSAAEQIASTYNSDLASQVGSSWLDSASSSAEVTSTRVGAASQGALTARQREDAVRADVSQWADDRAGWKSASIAVTESADAYSNGVMDFATQNGGATVRVGPDECVCDGCQELVDMGDIPIEDAADLDLPLHVGCDHRPLEVQYNPMDVPADPWLPVAA
jgi:hypothetical protein